MRIIAYLSLALFLSSCSHVRSDREWRSNVLPGSTLQPKALALSTAASGSVPAAKQSFLAEIERHMPLGMPEQSILEELPRHFRNVPRKSYRAIAKPSCDYYRVGLGGRSSASFQQVWFYFLDAKLDEVSVVYIERFL